MKIEEYYKSTHCAADVKQCEKIQKNKVMLVNAPNIKELGAAGNYSNFPAIGIVSLGARIQKDYTEVQLKVVDGGVLEVEEILDHVDDFKPDLLGISVLTSTYSEGLKIARHAKKMFDSTIVLGNDHVGFFPELVLKKRPFVDYVVAAEIGEEAFSFIVGKEFKQPIKYFFPNAGEDGIYYRNEDKIEVIHFTTKQLSMIYADEMDIPNVNLILEDYKRVIENYNKAYGKFHDQKVKPFIVNNLRGCGKWKTPCLECSIRDLRINQGDSNFFWKMVDYYNKKYGMNFFFEVCDSFLSAPNYIKDLIRVMPFDPKKRGIAFEVYARANDIVNNKESISWLETLNVKRVMIGLESGDDKMLDSINKGNRSANLSPVQINYEALRKLDQAGITFHASFVLGILGETKETLNNTLNFIAKIAKDFRKHLATLEASALIPLPNSPAWDYLLLSEKPKFRIEGGVEASLANYDIKLDDKTIKELRKKYENKDLLNTRELGKDWVKYFTHITWNDIEEAVSKCTQIGRETDASLGTVDVIM
jgi:radical SAM superfamily enzyme YgiQ (UPF0313 family)